MLRRADGETRVSNTGLSRVLLRGSNALDIRIETVNTYGERRHTEREAAVPTSEVQDALPAHEPLAAPLAKLVDGARPERGRDRGDVLSYVADQARRASAHVRVQLTSGFCDEAAREEWPRRILVGGTGHHLNWPPEVAGGLLELLKVQLTRADLGVNFS